MSLFEPTESLGTMPLREDEFSWADETTAEVEVQSVAPRRGVWLYGVLGIVVASLIARLAFLQITEGKSHQLLAQGNRVRTRELLPARGLITDRFGTVLASNVASFQLVIVPADLPSSASERAAIYALAADFLNQPVDTIRTTVEAEGLRSIHPVVLLEHLDQETALRFLLRIGNSPGILVAEQSERNYVAVPGIGHIMGYTGKVGQAELDASETYSYASIVGKSGIEKAYEQRLYGTPGVERVEVNSKGYFQRVIGNQPAVSGEPLALTIDAGLQQRLGELLAAKMTETQSSAAVGVVMDPRDGAVLAMVSLPDYDNNLFAGGISKDQLARLVDDPAAPLTNRAIAGVYPAGSVVKPMLAAAGLAEGVITEKTTLNIPAEIRIGDFVFPDWKAHGMTDVRKAISVSSDIFFYAIGGGWDVVPGLGIERLDRYLELFGFGKPTGIELSGESNGLVPTPDWKERVKKEPWYLGDTYHLSIGQGYFLATPLQVATSTAAVANGGTLVTPHLAIHDTPSPSATSILDDKWLAIARSGMRQAVESGSARQLQALPVTSGGKTGTAQFGIEEKTHAWFTAFAPYENPEIVITVLLDGGGAGNEVAEPVALEAMQWFFGEQHRRYEKN